MSFLQKYATSSILAYPPVTTLKVHKSRPFLPVYGGCNNPLYIV